MASKTVKRALLGFAQGALQGVQSYFLTKAAQEAERLKEERLAAIRSEERKFIMERDDKQAAAQAERDARIAKQQEERDARITAAQSERDRAQGDQRMREIEKSLAAQREIASTGRAPADGYRTVEMPDGTIKTMLNSEITQGLPKGAKIIDAQMISAGANDLRAQTAAERAEAEAAAAEARGRGARGPYGSNAATGLVEGAMCMTADRKMGRIKNGVCVVN